MLQSLLEDPANGDNDATSKPQQLYSSNPGNDDERAPGSSQDITSKSKPEELPVLEDTLGLLYLAAILCHLPISIRDVYDWMTEKDFVYLAAPTSVLPPSTLRQLPRYLKARLSARIGTPDPGQVHRITLRVSSLFQAVTPALQVQIPRLNFRLLLYRYIARLSLPLEVFPAVERLSTLLDYNYTFPRPKPYMHLSEHPELKLASVLVIATKLLYPFDNIRRSPVDPSEPGATAVDWEMWNSLHAGDSGGSGNADVQSRRENGRSGGTFDPTAVSAPDVPQMREHDVDTYMDWLQDTLIPAELPEPSDFQEALFKLFPLQDHPSTGPRPGESPHQPHDDGEDQDDDHTHPHPHSTSNPNLTILAKIQQSLHLRTPAPLDPEAQLHQSAHSQEQPHPHPHPHGSQQSHLPAPGTHYTRYRTAEAISERARPFFGSVARMCGLRVEELVGVVFRVEERVREWEGLERRRRRGVGREGDEKGKSKGRAEV